MAGLLDDSGGLSVKEQIAQLEQQIAMLQGGGQQGGQPQQGGMGLLAEAAGAPQQAFQPTMTPAEMKELFALMAQYGDDPMAAGTGYVTAMQRNDQLANSAATARNTVTDAMRPRPVGGGYMDKNGVQTVPIWDPNMNNGQGGIREQKLSQRFPDTMRIGDVQYIRNPNQPDLAAPDAFIPAYNPTVAGQNQGDFKEGEAVGSARGADRGVGITLTSEMVKVDGMLNDLMADPNFDASVGKLDQYTGSVGAWFGSKEGTLGKRAEVISNQLTRSSVADWKGAISNAELNFFKDSVPQRGDSSVVWRDWYNNVYKPTMEFAKLRAAGTLNVDNSNLSDFVQGQMGSAELDPLVQKYLPKR